MRRFVLLLAFAMLLLAPPGESARAADLDDVWIDLGTLRGFELDSLAHSAHPETGDPIQLATGRIGETEVLFQIQFDICETRRACSLYRLQRTFDLGQHYMRFKEGIRNPQRILSEPIVGTELDLAQRAGGAAIFGIGSRDRDHFPVIVMTKAAGSDLDAWRTYIRRAERVVDETGVANLPRIVNAPTLPFPHVPSAELSLDDLARWSPSEVPDVYDAWVNMFSISDFVPLEFRFAEQGRRQSIVGRIGTGRVVLDIQSRVCSVNACDEETYDHFLPKPGTYEGIFSAGVHRDVELFRGKQSRGGIVAFSEHDCIGSLVAFHRRDDGTYPMSMVASGCGEAKAAIREYVTRAEISSPETNRQDAVRAWVRRNIEEFEKSRRNRENSSS